MKLIVGLGNPGKEYEKTRHNIGFMIIDHLAEKLNVKLSNNKFNGIYYQGHINNEKVILLKPQTYMNLSGECVIQFVNYFNIEDEDILVVYDDMDLELGKIRLKTKGSSGGQNGMKNIMEHLHTQTISRLKFGIGLKKMIPAKDYVLGHFSKEDSVILKDKIDIATNACLDFLELEMTEIMNKYNAK